MQFFAWIWWFGVNEESKVIFMGLCHQRSSTMTLENLMTSLQTYIILLLMQLFAWIWWFWIMEEREVIFMGLCHRGSTTIYDLGGPDDLFADIGNFALYAIFLLNLLLMKEIKIIPMGSNHHVTITMTLENLMTSLQTQIILLFMLFFAWIWWFGVNEESKVILMGLCHQRSSTMTLENLMTSLQTYNFAVFAIF